MGVDVVLVVVVVVIVGRFPDIIIIIILTPSKGKTHFPARSGIMVRQNKKMEKVYIKNISRLLKRLAIDVEWKGIGLVPVVTKHLVDMYQASLKNKEKRV